MKVCHLPVLDYGRKADAVVREFAKRLSAAYGAPIRAWCEHDTLACKHMISVQHDDDPVSRVDVDCRHPSFGPGKLEAALDHVFEPVFCRLERLAGNDPTDPFCGAYDRIREGWS